MAAPSETYVDPSIAGNSGAGTIGDPYGDLQYALNTMTRDATNGDRINILTGTDEILAAQLSFATYGTPTATAPIIFQGYTSAAGDGGIGGISGNASVSVLNSTTLDWIHWKDLHLHNTGANQIVRVDRYCIFDNVEFDNTSGGGLRTNIWGRVTRCHFHNIGAIGLQGGTGTFAAWNTFENGTNDFTIAVSPGLYSSIWFNVFDLDGASDGISLGTTSSMAWGNSIYSNAGTGQGIDITTGDGHVVINNIVEGFSGVGGIGIQSVAANLDMYGYNAFYNNATDSTLGDINVNLGNNQSLGASAFTNAASDDFTVGTSVRALAFPTANFPSLAVRSYLDIGALQREEPAGGSTTAATGGIRLGHRKI